MYEISIGEIVLTYLDDLLEDIGQTDVAQHTVQNSTNHRIEHWKDKAKCSTVM